MQKLIGGALVAMLLTFVGVGKARAVQFTDVVNPSPNVFLTNSTPTHTFWHDISDTTFNSSAYMITSASIDLIFADDSQNDGIFGWDLEEESVRFNFDGSNYGVQAIDTGTVHFSIEANLLQSDGRVQVVLTRLAGDVYFDQSTLTAQATSTSTPTPTPEPGTWVLMGTGLVGLLGYGWRRKQHQTV